MAKDCPRNGSCCWVDILLTSIRSKAAALFNPLDVPHMDQSDVPARIVAVLLSLRARPRARFLDRFFASGILDANSNITMDLPSATASSRCKCPTRRLKNPLFERKLRELHLMGDFNREVSQRLTGRIHNGRAARQASVALQPQLPGAKPGNDQGCSQRKP